MSIVTITLSSFFTFSSLKLPFLLVQFVHKLKSRPPTEETKLQLMHDIALESGIEWNSKTLEQKLYKNLPASAPVSAPNNLVEFLSC